MTEVDKTEYVDFAKRTAAAAKKAAHYAEKAARAAELGNHVSAEHALVCARGEAAYVQRLIDGASFLAR